MYFSQRTKTSKAWLGQLAWALPFISFACGYLLLAKLYQTQEITAPSLVGKSLQEAFRSLSTHNLNLRILTEKEDPDLKEGTILSQTPLAGKQIKEHQSIFVAVSKAPPQKIAPNCINKTCRILKQELARAGIRARPYYLPSNYPKDHCFAQHPGAHEPVNDSYITLYISRGTENSKPIIWPDFTNRPVIDIIEFLKKHAINAQIIHPQKTDKPEAAHTCDTCVVVDQRPLVGSLVHLDIERLPQVQLQVN